MSANNLSRVEELTPSKLGTKEYWEEAYNKEVVTLSFDKDDHDDYDDDNTYDDDDDDRLRTSQRSVVMKKHLIRLILLSG